MLPDSIGTTPSLDEGLVSRIEEIVLESERNTRPLEVEPYRGQLFELFVTAEAAGYLEDGCDVDLTADGLCRRLAERFGLREAASSSVQRQVRLPEPHVAKMRLLWSVMRMWMEWTYAWRRWPEFRGNELDAE
jgi:hypothetical protein